MPVDICQPAAGKRSLTRTAGASSFDIFRSKDDRDPPFAIRVYNDSVVQKRNPFLEAARDIHDDDSKNSNSNPRSSNRPMQPFLRGESHIRFGEAMTPQEADASLVRRPGWECKQRELTGHHIFEGSNPVQGNGVGDGSDITGCCPRRPSSRSKTQELAGHNVFACASACDTPPPPPVLPYLPKEQIIPPHDIHRNPRKFESHILGAPDCEETSTRPTTCPSSSSSSSAFELVSKGGDDDDVFTRARLVEEAKMRAFQGNHIFEFNDEPRNEAEDEERFSLSKLARRRDIRGNDIFGGERRQRSGHRSWDRQQPSPAPCGKRHVRTCRQKSWGVDPQALMVNGPGPYSTTSDPRSSN